MCAHSQIIDENLTLKTATWSHIVKLLNFTFMDQTFASKTSLGIRSQIVDQNSPPMGPIDYPFGRVVLIGGADWKPENPKTQLGHIWPDNLLYFIPDSQNSYPRKPERPNNLKTYGISGNPDLFRRLVNRNRSPKCLRPSFDLFIREMYSNHI